MKKLFCNKMLFVITIIFVILSILLFEFGYCNPNWLVNCVFRDQNISYNFSLIRIVVYFAIITLVVIFNKKFIEKAIDVSQNKYKRILIYITVSTTIILLIFYFITILTPKTIEDTYIPMINSIILTKSLNIIITISMVIRAITVLIIALFATSIFIIYVSNDVVYNFIIIICTFGLVFSITTDFNHTIDEARHFATAFNVANFNIKYSTEPIADNAIKELPQHMKFVAIDNYLKNKYVSSIYKETNMEDIATLPVNYLFISYIFPAIGIFIAKTIGGSIIDIYIIGRIFNLILYCILGVIALKLIPFKKNILAIILCTPMLLVLAASYSIDGFCVGTCFVFIAYCLKIYKESDSITLKQTLILLGLFFLILTAKSMTYMFICIFALILPIIKTLKKNKKYLPIIIVSIVILLILLIAMGIYTKRTQLFSDVRGGNTNSSEQIKLLLTNPIHDVKLAINHITRTLFNYDWWTMLYVYAFFSDNSTYVMFAIMLFLLYVSITEDDYNFKLKDKIIMIITFLAVFGMTSIALYLSFTEVGSDFVNGYQTRYVFPVLPMLLFAISSKKIKVERGKNRNMNICIISTIFTIIGIAQMMLS